MLYHKTRYVEIYHGDCRDIIPRLDDMSVQVVVTSPPVCDWRFYREVTNLIWKPLIDRGVMFWHCLNDVLKFADAVREDGWILVKIIPLLSNSETEHIVVLAKSEDHIWGECESEWQLGDERRETYICSNCAKVYEGEWDGKRCSCGQGHYLCHTATFSEELVRKCVSLASEYFVYGAILDPFCGSGTVGAIGKELWRRAILIDIVEKACEMAKRRTE